jgi:hypothetical protein
MILASGTVLATRLLYERAWRRFIPYIIPVLYVFLSQFVIQNLDRNYERMGEFSQLEPLRAKFYAGYNKQEQKPQNR